MRPDVICYLLHINNLRVLGGLAYHRSHQRLGIGRRSCNADSLYAHGDTSLRQQQQTNTAWLQGTVVTLLRDVYSRYKTRVSLHCQLPFSLLIPINRIQQPINFFQPAFLISFFTFFISF